MEQGGGSTDKIVDVAGYIVKRYREISGENLDEMKLQNLLYLTQREAFAVTGKQAFEGNFEGWRFGPVSREVRAVFYDGEIVAPTAAISDEVQYIANNVIAEYGPLTSWKLSELSHAETSWRNARHGLTPAEKLLSIADIREDAKKVRPYDYVWDMYYDEFQTEIDEE